MIKKINFTQKIHKKNIRRLSVPTSITIEFQCIFEFSYYTARIARIQVQSSDNLIQNVKCLKQKYKSLIYKL